MPLTSHRFSYISALGLWVPSPFHLPLLSILLSQPVDGGIQLIDLGQALAQQDFESANRALLIFQFAPQAADGGLERVVLFFPADRWGAASAGA